LPNVHFFSTARNFSAEGAFQPRAPFARRATTAHLLGGLGDNLTLCTEVQVRVSVDEGARSTEQVDGTEPGNPCNSRMGFDSESASEDHRRMERRSSFRQLTCIPAAFDTEKNTGDLALICDASTTGARLFTRGELKLEEPVTLELYLGPAPAEPKKVDARVVRVEKRPPTVSEVWPWEIAVEFDEPISAYQKEIEDLCRRQEASGILKR
jgi:hypothetical protein